MQAASSKVTSDIKKVTQQVRHKLLYALLFSKHAGTSIAVRVLMHALLVEAKPSASNLDCCRVSLTAGSVIEWIYGLWNLTLQQICIAPFERAIQCLGSHYFQARSHQQLFAKAASHLSGL